MKPGPARIYHRGEPIRSAAVVLAKHSAESLRLLRTAFTITASWSLCLYTGQRGYHPLLAVAAGTGDVLMARLREGRANTARGAAHFLRETVGRVRYAGAKGQLTVRADSGFYTHSIVAVCREMDVRYSITVRQRQSLHHQIEAIPEGDGATLELEADHRRHAKIENAIRDLKYGVGLNHLPSGPFAANAAWLAVQVMAHNLARWTARIGLGERIVTTKTLRRRFFSLAGRITRSARRLTLHLPMRWPWEEKVSRALARLRAIPLPA